VIKRMALTHETFGCKTCLPPDADNAWEAVKLLTIDSELFDESHFMIKLRACPRCQQRFLSVFTETIDWADGEDPQFWSVLPITPTEAKHLLDAGSGIMPQLNALAPTRRSLCHDFQKGESPRSFWSSGVSIGPHD
jgi:hypothetical protein